MAASDEQLMERLKGGDHAAFAELYDRYAPRVNGLLIKLLGRRSSAEDVLQETFWQVWSRAEQYDSERSSPPSWLLLIARSRARDHLRRTRGQPIAAEHAEPVAPEPAVELERRESAEQAAASLRQLPDEQRNAISLAFYGGMTYEEIARRQAVPLGTIKTRIRRGMHRMRDMLNGEVHTKGRRDDS